MDDDTLAVVIGLVLGVGLGLGIVFVALFRDEFLSPGKSPKVKTFRLCTYMGGSDVKRQKRCRSVRIVVRKETIDLGGWAWEGKELEIPRNLITDARRLERPDATALKDVDLAEEFERLAEISAKANVFWNWVVLSWRGGNAAVMFNSSRKATDFIRLIQEDAANVDSEFRQNEPQRTQSSQRCQERERPPGPDLCGLCVLCGGIPPEESGIER